MQILPTGDRTAGPLTCLILGDQNISRLALSTEDINNIIAIRPEHSTVNT